VLAQGGSALDACEAVVRELEDNELFNAGRGAALTERGTIELDAAIMDGSTEHYGAVTGVTTVRNPVSLARRLMRQQRFRMLAGAGAEAFADSVDQGDAHTKAGDALGIERVPNEWFITPRRRQMLQDELASRAKRSAAPTDIRQRERVFGTVGCVALDSAGNLAAATSTGGVTGKPSGRVGDAPLVGSGTLATSRVAVSCTGTGEQFIRVGAARQVEQRMLLLGESVHAAAEHVIARALAKDDGGLIALCSQGTIAMPYSTPGMYRAWARERNDGVVESGVAIFEEQR
jgi:beta-aspartyl-peptidase (threonine type)